jgi:hypothetical protein
MNPGFDIAARNNHADSLIGLPSPLPGCLQSVIKFFFAGRNRRIIGVQHRNYACGKMRPGTHCCHLGNVLCPNKLLGIALSAGRLSEVNLVRLGLLGLKETVQEASLLNILAAHDYLRI